MSQSFTKKNTNLTTLDQSDKYPPTLSNHRNKLTGLRVIRFNEKT